MSQPRQNQTKTLQQFPSPALQEFGMFPPHLASRAAVCISSATSSSHSQCEGDGPENSSLTVCLRWWKKPLQATDVMVIRSRLQI